MCASKKENGAEESKKKREIKVKSKKAEREKVAKVVEQQGDKEDKKTEGKKEKKKTYKGDVNENKVIVWGIKDANEIYDLGYFGKIKDDDRNELALEEAMLLVNRNRLDVRKNGRKISRKKFYEYACSVDKEFPWKYRVYEDLRNRGLLARTGFKFGTHFRVYGRGVRLIKGPKKRKEHTKWIVHAVPETFICSFPELARAVRLAHNIRAKMLWAVVDNEGDVTYYEIIRKTP